MKQRRNGQHGAVTHHPEKEPTMASASNDERQTFLHKDKEWFKACHDETLDCIDQQLFGFLAHLRACEPLTELEFHCYGFRDSSGYRLLIPVPCRVTAEEIIQRPGYDALAQFCDPRGYWHHLTTFYRTGKACSKNDFVHMYYAYHHMPHMGFQLMIAGSSPTTSLVVRPSKTRK
jgi:hypothetical protein